MKIIGVKDIAKYNDFVTFISSNSSQDIFNTEVNLTQSKYLSFGLHNEQ